MHTDSSRAGGSPTRRDFLRMASAATSAAFGIPWLVPGSVLGASAPSNRITLGLIGSGNQGACDLKRGWFLQGDVQVVAVCDVNTASDGYLPGQYLGRKPVQEMVNKHYAKKTPSGQYKGCDAYKDFRELLARDDIDAVAIVTPDQWHGVMTVMAAAAGKDIYCQKPLSLTIRQGQEMIKAVRKHDCILQTGSQFRSDAKIRYACELVRNGRIGQLKRITTFVAPNNYFGPGPGWKPMPVPDGFDYDMWLGPAPEAPYHKDRCFYRFRFILDYSGGQTTNFGAHSNDIAQLGHADNPGPVEIEDLGAEWPPKGDLFTTALKVHFRARYADGVELTCITKEPRMGARFEGTEGWVQCGWGGLKTQPESLKTSKIGPDEIHLPKSPGPYRNFVDAVKAHKDPIAPVEIGHRTASLCHLGNIAMRLGRKVKWDPQKERFVDDNEANSMLSRPLRAPWHL